MSAKRAQYKWNIWENTFYHEMSKLFLNTCLFCNARLTVLSDLVSREHMHPGQQYDKLSHLCLPCPRWIASSLPPGFAKTDISYPLLRSQLCFTIGGCLLWTGWRPSSPFCFSFPANEGHGVKWLIYLAQQFLYKGKRAHKKGDEMWISWSLSLIPAPFHVEIENCVLVSVNGC